jgi:hypothetical protein
MLADAKTANMQSILPGKKIPNRLIYISLAITIEINEQSAQLDF